MGIQHNVDELLVGILKQIRLHEAQDSKQELKQQQKQQKRRRQSLGNALINKDGNGSGNNHVSSVSSVSSPLHTLQVARDILAKVCLNAASSAAAMSKSCENLHVL